MPERPEARDLPRPATPGPWLVPERATIHGYGVDAADGLMVADCRHAKDAAAIAALPEWIAAHDAEQEARERAQAALAEVRAWATPRFGGGILAILDKHGYGEAS